MVSSSSLKPDTAPVPESAGMAAATAATSSAMAAAAAVASRSGSEARVSKPALATKLLSLSGVFAVHKPKGPTSAELLNRLKEKLLAGTAAGWGPGRGEAVAVRAEAAQSTLGFSRSRGSRDKRKGKGARPQCKLWTEIWGISGLDLS